METLKYFPILILFILFSCNKTNNEKDQAKPEPLETRDQPSGQYITLTKNQGNEADIQKGTLQKKNVSEKISCNGIIKVSPAHIVTVIPPVKGYIKELYHKTGDYVKKGARLARLSHPGYLKIQEEYLSVKSQADYYEQEYKRQGELAVEEAASMKKMQKAKANYEEYHARFQSLKMLLKKLNLNPEKIENGELSSDIYLYAPMNGHITELFLNRGKISDENNPVFELMNMNKVILKLNVYEKDVSDLTIGQQVQFSIVKNPDHKYSAKIKNIGNKIDEQKRTFPVIASINNPVNQFKHGLYVNADILLSSKAKYVLPNEAIARIEGKPFVFVIKENGYAPVEVKIGPRGEHFTEIINYEDLQNQKLVVKGAYFLSGELSLE